MTEIETTVTYLEMTAPPKPAPTASGGAGVALVETKNCTNSFYLYLYTGVGRAFHWVERRRWTPEQLRTVLDNPSVRLWTLLVDGCPAGYVELASDAEGGVEIAYFGLLPEFHGRGLGKFLLQSAIDLAWALDPAPNRVWLHTCTLDAPQALPNYVARGFVPYKTEIEIIRTIDDRMDEA